jgi:hypothetical protein
VWLLRALIVCSLGSSANLADSFFPGVHQLTSGGQNAEAYWSPDGKRLIWNRPICLPARDTTKTSSLPQASSSPSLASSSQPREPGCSFGSGAGPIA